MVSFAGAEAAAPLITRIAALQNGIALLQQALALTPVIWKMSADVYLMPPGAPSPVSQSLALQYDLSEPDSVAILNAVLAALQDQLKTTNNALAAIT